MDEVSLNDVSRDLLHECGIGGMSLVQDSRNTDNFLPMSFHSHISSFISFVIPIHVTLPAQVGIDLILGNMPLHFCDVDGMWSFGTRRLFEVVPQVAIRDSFPIALAPSLLALLETPKDVQTSIHKGLAVSADMDRTIGQDGNNGSS